MTTVQAHSPPTTESTEHAIRPRRALSRWLTSPLAARLTSYVAGLLLWQLVATIFDRFPAPLEITSFLVGEIAEGHLVSNFAVTLNRFGQGMLIAVVIGVILGILIGSYRGAEAFLNDINVVGLAIPAVIWALLATMWFGFGDRAPIVTVILSAVPFVTVNVAQGVRAIDPRLGHMSAAFGVPASRRMRHLTLPAIAGYVFAAIRFAVMSGWNGILLSEWFGATSGVGWRARYWYDANRMPGFLAWVVFFIVFMLLVDRGGLGTIAKRSFRWRDGDAAGTTEIVTERV